MNRRHFLIAIGAGIGAAGGCLGSTGDDGSDGPAPLDGRYQYGYDAGNSNYAPGVAGPTNEPSFQRLYKDVGGVPLTDDETLFTSTEAIDFNGNRVWDSPPPVDGRRVGSALYGDSVLCAGNDPRLFYAISKADGNEQWRTELSAAERAVAQGATVATSPQQWLTVQGEHAYVSTGIGIGCVDLADREEAWHTDLYEMYPAEADPGFLLPAATSDYIYTVNEHQGGDELPVVYAIDSDSGEVVWTAEIEGGAFGFSPPTIGDRYVLVTSAVNEPPDAEGDHQWSQIAAIDPSNGDVAWRQAVAGISHHGPVVLGHAVAGEMVYIGHGIADPDEPGHLSALTQQDGSSEWTADLTTAGFVTVTVTDDLVYASDGQYYRAFDQSNGDEVWSVDVVEILAGTESESSLRAMPSPPIVHDGRLFVYLGEGEVLELS